MEALILCGGFATRLEPITLFVPKPLLPIGGRPILDRIVDDAAKTKEVKRIIISTNKKFGDQFEYWMGNKKASGMPKEMQLLVEPTMHDGNKFGAIKGIEYAIKNAKVDDDLMIIAGDNVYGWSVSTAVDEFVSTGRKATVCVHDVGSLDEAKKFGVVGTENGIVSSFEEKPAEPKSTIASTGIYIYPRELLGKFSEYLAGENNPDAPGHFLKWLIGNTEVHAVVQDGTWFDIGTLETYRKVFEQFNGTE